ncbi:MAG TPA: hypothetical protein DCG57_12935 [Candidatus Riflebacteria bacterium]|nr:hypothetical protein [Candidatus Riflebacteria bacterium]
MTDRRQSRLAVLFVLILLAVVGTLSPLYARVRPIVSPDDIESIRFLSANNLPVKVLAVYSPEFGNLQFIAALIDIIANMHENGLVKKEDAFKLHLIATRASRSSNFKQLHTMVAADRLKKYVEFSSLETESDVWMQDWGEVGVVKLKSEKKPQTVVFDSNRGRDNAELPGILASFWNSYLLKNPSTQFSGGDYGGNIEVTPDNILLIGNTSTPELRGFLEKNGYKNRMAVLETDWLHVGHVDEYISVCPNAKAARGYTLIKANPRLALRLIKDSSLADLRAIPLKDYRDAMIEVRKYLLKAEVNRAAQKKRKNNEALPEDQKFGVAVLNYLELSETTSESGMELATGHMVRGSEVEEFIKLNLTLANLIDANLKKACEKISEVRKEKEGKLHSIISFPALFRAMYGGKHIAYIPGSVNQLILNNQLIVPDPKIEIMRKYIARTLGKMGLQANFVDSLPYHNLQGQIHCGTNVFRHPNKYFVKPR